MTSDERLTSAGSSYRRGRSRGSVAAVRIGVNASSDMMFGRSANAAVQLAVDAEEAGLQGFSVGQFPSSDAVVILGAVAAATRSIEISTAATTMWRSHPLTLAGQALTISDLSDGRFVLGVGAGHKAHVEDQLRVPFDHPVARFEEFLSILQPAMIDRKVDFSGRFWSANTELGSTKTAAAPPVLAAALGPRMLDLAGSLTDGVVLWLASPAAIASKVAPALSAAADRAGRDEPRIMASAPVFVTDDPEAARMRMSLLLQQYADLPSYNRILADGGVGDVGDVALVGSEDQVMEGLAGFAEAGCTDFHAVLPPTRKRDKQSERPRTFDLLRSAVGSF